MNLRIALLFPLITLGLGACARDTVPLNEVLNYGNCSGLTAGVREVTLDEVASIRGMIMFGADESTPVDQSGMPRLIAISRGEQPTAGYSMTLGEDGKGEGRVEGAALHVQVEWKSPPADAVTAQMVSHPCLVISLPDPAPAEVVVTTTDGETIGRLSLTEGQP